MAVYRINKTKDYTTISNHHLREKDMSLKAKGLLTLYLSLPEDWDFSSEGIANICIEHKQTINKVNQELEKFKYLKRTKITDDKGRFTDWQYDIYEHPLTNFPLVEKPLTVNSPQLNTKEQNTKELNKYIVDRFKKPDLEDVIAYCKERNNNVNPNKWFDYYTANGWKVGKNPMKDWKASVRTWEENKTVKKTERRII